MRTLVPVIGREIHDSVDLARCEQLLSLCHVLAPVCDRKLSGGIYLTDEFPALGAVCKVNDRNRSVFNDSVAVDVSVQQRISQSRNEEDYKESSVGEHGLQLVGEYFPKI